MIANLVERLADVPPPVICVIIAALACAETAAFIGLAAPGEISVVFGGVLAFQGRVGLTAITLSAVGGAIAGDSLGFYLGRRFGGHLTDGRIGRLMGVERVERTMARIRAGGIRAIILGRFVGVLRAVMPFAAGASGMSYARFLVASVVGASAWGVFFTMAGYFAGNQWRRVEHYAGRASTVIAIVLVTVVLIVLVAKKAAARQEAIVTAWRRFLVRPRVAAFHQRYRRQIAFLAARFRPGPALGLQLTVSLVALAGLGYALALVVGQVLNLTGLASFDRAVLDALSRQPRRVVEAMAVVHQVVSPSGAVTAALVAGAIAWAVDRRPRALTMLGLAAVGGWALAQMVTALVERPSPFFGHALRERTFPAQATTVVAATVIALLVVLLPRIGRWTWAVAITAVGVTVVFAAGFAEIFVARAYLSDAVGGLTLGVTWGLAAATGVATLWRARAHHAAIAENEAALAARAHL